MIISSQFRDTTLDSGSSPRSRVSEADDPDELSRSGVECAEMERRFLLSRKGFMRWWAEFSKGNIEVMLAPEQAQFLASNKAAHKVGHARPRR